MGSFPLGVVPSVRTTPHPERVGSATLHQRLMALLALLVARPPASLHLSQFLLMQQGIFQTWTDFDLDFHHHHQVGTLLLALDLLFLDSVH